MEKFKTTEPDEVTTDLKQMILSTSELAGTYVPGSEIVEKAIEHIPEEEKEKMTGDPLISDEQLDDFYEKMENILKK